MNDLNEINDNINELIMNKSFDRLTNEEKIKALEHAGSEEGYNTLRHTLLAIASSFNGETEEDFAGDDVKTDLMSQFEKKYGTSGNRTKVIPLYRKPYFQLAIAASLALLVFLAIPVFKQTGENHKELAVTQDKSSAVNNNEPAAMGDNLNVGVNKPDVGSAATTGENSGIPTEENKIAADREQGVLPAINDRKDKKQDDHTVLNGQVKQGENFNFETAPNDELSNKLAPVKEKAKGEDMETYSGKNDKYLSRNSNTVIADDHMAHSKQEAKKDVSAKEKEKTSPPPPPAEYKKHAGDHTFHHAERMDELAAGATSTGPAKNTANVVSFVEHNKTEMLDLLFTVY